MVEIDSAMFDLMTLPEDAFDTAVNAATEAHVAGLDESTQLEHGIKTYLLALRKLGYSIVATGQTKLPDLIVEADAMIAIAEQQP